MTKKNILETIERLKERYPSDCQLIHSKDYELLFSVRLSAQCTDARVNMVTPTLFSRFPTLEAFAEADVEEIRSIIKSCGFYVVKGADIKNAAIMLLEKFDGKVPDNMEDLLSLPGVGRKTANLILGDIYGQPAVVADTHCIRISNHLGLADSKDPYKVEMALKKVIPPAEQNDFCHRLVQFGRDICTARSPKCDKCFLNDICPDGKKMLKAKKEK
ncbi:MAG: endonuclease III [Clostridia bacterium]|nr:endonuclease III [Clostridia bacterium]